MHPRTLSRISATLFSYAISAVSFQKTDVKALLEGVSFFAGRLLNWTLVGVINHSFTKHSQSTLKFLE